MHGDTFCAPEKSLLGMIASGLPLPAVLNALCGFFEVAAADWERRETELKRSEAFLAQAQRLTKTGSSWWKPSAGAVTWSEENYRLMGYPVGVTPTVEMALDRCHPDDLALVQEKLDLAIREGTTIDIEHRLLMPDGCVKHVRVVFENVASAGEEPEFVGAATDITEWKHTEERLRQSEACLAEAQKLSQTGSISWRVGDDRHSWSDETFRIFGYDRSTQPGCAAVLRRVHPQDLHEVQKVIVQVERGQRIDHECRLLMPDGYVKHVHIVAHGVPDGNGRLEIVGALQDVTRQRRSEAVLGRLRSELAQAARVTSVGTLTASIAHEVSQPLSGIVTNVRTCLRMLESETPDIEGARETVRRAIRDSSRAAEVIARLRALFTSRQPAPEPVDLNDATREVLALLRSELQQNQVVVVLDLADDLPCVPGDRIQLQQVVINLLRNASEAMSAINDRPRQIAITTALCDDELVSLSVRDSGVGFDRRRARKLFDAFYTTKEAGMGIGLSVSRAIIESHRGRLFAVPNEPAGATVSFSIPCGRDESARSVRRLAS